MPTLRNNFDGGPDGTALTAANSGQVPGNDPFQIVTAASAYNHIEFHDAYTLGRGTAEYVLLISTQNSDVSSAVVWTTGMGSQSQVWLRMYLYLTDLPVTTGCAVDAPILQFDNGTVYMGWAKIERTTGAITMLNGAETSSITSTNVLPLNKWARVEMWYKFSTTVGQVELRLFLDPDSDTADETVTSAANWNLGAATANSYGLGYPNLIAYRPELYISGLELNNVAYPGPAPFKAKGVPGIQPNPVAIHTDTR
jgi:hypothetical protein